LDFAVFDQQTSSYSNYCPSELLALVLERDLEWLWLLVNDLKDLAFDHNKILKDYRQWRKTKAPYIDAR
jgi:hypothetical protein